MAIPPPPPLPPFWGDATRGGVTSILRHGGVAVAQGAPLGPAPLRQGASEAKQLMSQVPKEETFPFGCEEGLGGSTEEGKARRVLPVTERSPVPIPLSTVRDSPQSPRSRYRAETNLFLLTL